MKANELNEHLKIELDEAEIVSSSASVMHFMQDMRRHVKNKGKVTVTITDVSDLKTFNSNVDPNPQNWGFVKGGVSWKVEKDKE